MGSFLAAGGLHYGKGKFAAGQEAGVFAGSSQEIGFGQNLEDVVLLKGLDGRRQIEIRAEQKDVEKIAEIEAIDE